MATKFGHKSAYNSASMADRSEMFAPTMGFSGMADSTEPRKMLWGRPLLPWQRNLCKFGLFFDKIGHESSCMPHTPDMFGSTRGDDQRGRSLLLPACQSINIKICNARSGRRIKSNLRRLCFLLLQTDDRIPVVL